MLFDQEMLQLQLDEVIESFIKDLKSISTGRANPSTFENIIVDVTEKYGSKMALSGVAKISIRNAITVEIEVWDMNIVSEVDKALQEASLGGSINAGSAKNVFIINFHPLTEEDRDVKVKELGKLLEERKVRVRHVRQEYMED